MSTHSEDIEKYPFLLGKSSDDFIFEWCPLCDNEVELKEEFRVQLCPICGKYILPCDMCDHNISPCGDCPLEKARDAMIARKQTILETYVLDDTTKRSLIQRSWTESELDWLEKQFKMGA